MVTQLSDFIKFQVSYRYKLRASTERFRYSVNPSLDIRGRPSMPPDLPKMILVGVDNGEETRMHKYSLRKFKKTPHYLFFFISTHFSGTIQTLT